MPHRASEKKDREKLKCEKKIFAEPWLHNKLVASRNSGCAWERRKSIRMFWMIAYFFGKVRSGSGKNLIEVLIRFLTGSDLFWCSTVWISNESDTQVEGRKSNHKSKICNSCDDDFNYLQITQDAVHSKPLIFYMILFSRNSRFHVQRTFHKSALFFFSEYVQLPRIGYKYFCWGVQ